MQFQWSSKEEERKELWALRHKGYYAILASAPGKRAIVTDIYAFLQTELGKAVLETQKIFPEAEYRDQFWDTLEMETFMQFY